MSFTFYPIADTIFRRYFVVVVVETLALNVPKFLTEHAIRTFLPAGTVTFSITSVNSGSSTTTRNEDKM